MTEENVVEEVSEPAVAPVEPAVAPAVAPVVAPAEKELTFVFKVSQANTILAALDEMPHKLSRGIIDSMQQQAVPQLQEQSV